MAAAVVIVAAGARRQRTQRERDHARAELSSSLASFEKTVRVEHL